MVTAETTNELPPPSVTSTHQANRPLRVIVVGAGGTGGRLIPPLMQVLKRGDSVAIVDGDHVEDRNLTRQNFRTRDIGENKAEVMARRYRRDGIQTDAFATMLTPEVGAEIAGSSVPLVILGCVDNPKARNIMDGLMEQRVSIWIDGGNERRGGQVLLSASRWPCNVKDPTTNNARTANWTLRGLTLAMPQLLRPQPWHCVRCDVPNKAGAERCSKCKQPEDSCRDRIDLQTVAVNQLSASCMLNALSLILYQVPFSTCGSFFSTLNTMSPIKLSPNVNWSSYELRPETTYADPA